MEEFRAYCSVDPKTGERAFERDKASLVELGVPLRWIPPEHADDEDGSGGYLVERDKYYLPELELSASEHALLSIAGAAAASVEGFPRKKEVLRALNKLGFDVDEISAPQSSVLTHAPLSSSSDSEHVLASLELLHDAVMRRCRVELVYAGKSTRDERLVDPYGLYYRQGIWYLVGYCHLRQSERTFHVGRIKELAFAKRSRRGGSFKLPDAFDINLHSRRRPWEYPREEPVEVTIRLAKRLVPAVPEIFGGRAKVEEVNETALVRVPVTYRPPFIAAVLPFGADAEVISPLDLREEVGAIFKELAQTYQGEAS
jgi:proteasome accessory factor B